MTFDALRDANRRRCDGSYHGVDAWSPTGWACALAGELGEACNLIKKLRRLQTGPDTYDPNGDANELIADVAEELADAVIYADLLAARLGVDLGEAVRSKFNATSRRIGSEERL